MDERHSKVVRRHLVRKRLARHAGIAEDDTLGDRQHLPRRSG